jgi:hypothetical protein
MLSYERKNPFFISIKESPLTTAHKQKSHKNNRVIAHYITNILECRSNNSILKKLNFSYFPEVHFL